MSILLSKLLFFMKHLLVTKISFQILLVLSSLGLSTESTLSWTDHIDYLLPKLCMACYTTRTIKPFMCQENLKSIYYSYLHSWMTYGIIFWSNSTHSIHVFPLQRRVIRIITDSRPRDSCRQLFKKLRIFPLMSQYIYKRENFISDEF